jgi:hypothetical protein
MSPQIRPSPREQMELQRRCREECQPCIDLMVRAISMETGMIWIVRDDGTFDRMHVEESAYMKDLRAQVDAIVKRYTALAGGGEPSDNAATKEYL